MMLWLAECIASIFMLDERCDVMTQDLKITHYQLHAMNDDPLACVPNWLMRR